MVGEKGESQGQGPSSRREKGAGASAPVFTPEFYAFDVAKLEPMWHEEFFSRKGGKVAGTARK